MYYVILIGYVQYDYSMVEWQIFEDLKLWSGFLVVLGSMFILCYILVVNKYLFFSCYVLKVQCNRLLFNYVSRVVVEL